MKKSKKNNYALIVLIVLLIALAIGYAAFQTVLTVNGVATGTITWNVHFTSDTKFYEISNGAKGSAITDTDRASVTVNTQTNDGQAQAQTVDATVALKYPGDAVILETVILNESTQPAKLTGFTVTGATNGLIVTQPTNSSITPGTVGGSTGDVLSANNGTCTAQFLVKWDASAATFGDSTNHRQQFKITFTYSQDTTDKTYTPTHTDS